jgi:hypothetical protein
MALKSTTLFGALAALLFSVAVATAAPEPPAPPLTPLRVSASGRYFENAQGQPWLWLGDTNWPLLTAYTPQEAKTYLDARAQSGFTIVQTVAAWDGGTGTEAGAVPNPDTAGVQPWRDHDPLQPNEAYWKHVDAIIARAARDHLYVGLLPAWGSFAADYKMLTAANAEAYGRWLGHRYRNAPNIVWILDGDRPVAASLEVWRAEARGLREGDGGVHPITLHPKGDGSVAHGEPWLAADMIQTWAQYTRIPAAIAGFYARTPVKPVILGEGAYEAGPQYPTGPITPLVVRQQAYWAYLSGGSFTYGHDAIWRKSPHWRDALHSDGAQDMRVLRRLFDGLAWWQLRPDQALFATGEGHGKSYNAAAVAADGSWAMVYFSHPSQAHLNLGQLKAPRLRATWVNPATGQRLPEGSLLMATGAANLQTPPDWPDAVLLLQPTPAGAR